jgi:hypothetical protein
MNRSILVALLVSYAWRWRAEHVPMHSQKTAASPGISKGKIGPHAVYPLANHNDRSQDYQGDETD